MIWGTDGLGVFSLCSVCASRLACFPASTAMSNCDDAWDNVASVKQCIHKKNNEAKTNEVWSQPGHASAYAAPDGKSVCVRSGLSGLRLLVVYE